MAVKDYNTDPDLNTTISGINIAEGCPPSGINNAIRQLMADVKAEKDARDEAQTAQTARDAAQDKAISDEVAARESAVSTLDESIADEVAARESAVSALDAAVVHKSGAETIAGAKTFSTTPIVKGNSPALCLNEDTFEKGVLPTTNQHWGIIFNDKNNSMHGRVQHYVNSNGQTATTLTTTSVDGSVSGTLGVVVRANGTVEGYCPTTPADSTGKQIVTAAYAKDTYLAKSGGTMTGILRSSLENCAIASDADNKDIVIFGGSAYRKGAFLKLIGKDKTQDPGCVEIVADDGTTDAVLRVYPNGTADIKGKPILTLVSEWHSGANWYRKYSDGWIEQGGHSTYADSHNHTITFHTAFTSNNCSVQRTGIGTSTDSNPRMSSYAVSAVSKTGFTAFCHSGMEGGFYWYACGY